MTKSEVDEMKKEVDKKARKLFDETFKKDLSSGKFKSLFSYLKDNKDKYVLSIRTNFLTLYSHGRKLNISKNNNYYIIEFDMNNADYIVSRDPNRLDEIVNVLDKLNFDTTDYPSWKKMRTEYLNSSKNEKTKYAKKPKLIFMAKISLKEIEEYDFESLLETIYPIFRSYRLARAEENFKQSCIAFYDSFDRDLIVLDSEYKPAFKTNEEELDYKKLCMPNMSGLQQFFKPDLVALIKENDKYKTVFIELKINISASIGKTANIVDHLIDWENYKNLYTHSQYERNNFEQSIIYMLSFFIEHGLIACRNLDEVIGKIDFDTPPDIKIVCGLTEETESMFIDKLQTFMKSATSIEWEKWNKEIIVGNDSPELLSLKGTPLNEYIREGKSQGHYQLPSIKQDILEIAPIYLDEEYDEKTKKQLQREFNELSNRKLQIPLRLIDTLAKQIDLLEYPIVYEGLMEDSLIAYILGLTMKNPMKENKKYRPFKEDTARLYVPKDVIEKLLTFVKEEYGDDITIEKLVNGNRIMYYGYKIKIDLIEKEMSKYKLS